MKKTAIFLVSLLIVSFLSPSFSLAATTNLQATINPGTLTISNPTIATISAVTLEGTSQESTGSLGSITVVDNRGNGAGWSVTMTVSDFTCCTPVRTIGVSDLTVKPGLVTVVAGKQTGVNAGEDHKFSATDDAATLMVAVTGGGLGSYRISPSIALSVPADAYAGTYTATVTVTVI